MSQIFDEIAEVIGKRATRRLIEASPRTGPHGRRHLYIPNAQSLTDQHLIVRAVGWSAARQLCRVFEHAIIELPRHPRCPLELRRALVFELFELGIEDPNEIHRILTDGGKLPVRASIKTIGETLRDLRALRGGKRRSRSAQMVGGSVGG